MSGDRLFDCLSHWAAERPESLAAVDSGRQLSYAALENEVRAFALSLLRAGVQRGDRVAVLAPPGADFLVSFIASAAIGAIWVGLNPRHTEPELDRTIARIEPRIVVAARSVDGRDYREWLQKLPCPAAGFPFGEGAPAGEADSSLFDEALARVEADDPCLIVFTSGTTGQPKGALISQAALVGASRVQGRQWPVAPLRVLNNLPINHIGCVGDLSCWALVDGGAIVFCERFDPARSLELIESEAVTIWGQVPTMFQLTLAAEGFDPARLRSLKLIFWGGAHASAELVQALSRLAPWLATSYGQTETVGSIAFTDRDAAPAALSATVGRPVEPYRIRIVDDSGADVADGGTGEVVVRTPFGMSGYWRDDAATAASRFGAWHRTGDLGLLGPGGELRLVGRLHDVFKSGGYNIYPAEIEAALEGHPAVAQASLVAVPDPLFGEVGVAALVARPGAGAGDSDDGLRAHLRVTLANYKIPKHIFWLPDLPRLPVGKVDKAALRACLAERLRDDEHS